MKTPTTLYSRLALITSVTLVVGYFVVYAAWSSLTVGEVGPGATITTGLMTKIKDNFEDLNTRVSNFSFNAGNVGIGTVSPGARLDVYDSASVSTADLLIVRDYLGGSTDKTRLIIKNGGNVGIGTATPTTPLDVRGGTNVGRFISASSASGDSIAQFESAAGNVMFIRANGNVGIGTITPTQRLDLGGGAIGDGNLGGSIKFGGAGIGGGSSGSCVLSAYSDQTTCPAGWTRIAPGLCAKCQ